jgi:NADPH2:quinone reductase
MKSIVYTQTGDPSVLQLVESELPEPAAGEVRVRIVVSGVNPTDWKSRRGSAPGQSLPFPEVVPNLDAGGVVDAVGAGVDGLAVGDRVWTYLASYQRFRGGTAQEYTVLPASRVVPLPAAASFELGASLGVPAMTAHRALTVDEDGPTRLSPGALDGKVILVAGGAGAVGHAAIQLAKWAGATVITTVSGEEKAALVAAAGADHIVNYREPGAAEAIRAIAPNGVDLVAEVAAGHNLELDLAVLRASRGVIVIYANDGGGAFNLDIRANMGLNARYQFVMVYTVGQRALDAAAADITAAVADGAMPVGDDAGLPLHRFPLDRTADAHAAVESGVVGKVLVEVS